MFGIQTSNTDEIVSSDLDLSATAKGTDQNKIDSWQRAEDAFKAMGRWQRRVDDLGQKRDLKALAHVYDIYVDYHDTPDEWRQFLADKGLHLAKQTKYLVSPAIGFLFGFTKRNADKTKQSHWAAAIHYAVNERIEPCNFIEAIEQNGGIYQTARLLKEASKTKIERSNELKADRDAANKYAETHRPVSVKSEGITGGLIEGFYTAVLRVGDNGQTEVVGLVEEPHSTAHKRYMKIVYAKDTASKKPKAVASYENVRSTIHCVNDDEFAIS